MSTIKELQRIAKDNGLKGYYRFRKAELERYLSDKGILKQQQQQQKPQRAVPPELINSENKEIEEKWGAVEQAFKKGYRRFRIAGADVNVERYFEMKIGGLKKLIENQLRDLGSVKVQTTLWVKWVMDGDIFVDKAFNSKMTEVFMGSNVDEIVDKLIIHMKNQVENPALPRSGFFIHGIVCLDIDFHKLNLTRGSSYIVLPNWIEKKKAVINPTNENDEECFRWAIIAALNHEGIKKDQQRISKLRPYANRYNWDDVEFPTAKKSIDKFEKNNPDIAINVLYVSGNEINIQRKSKCCDRKDNVNLLLVGDGERKHYTAIKSLSRLLGSENTKNEHKEYYCINCLQGFHCVEARDRHYEYCIDHDAVKVVMPTDKGKWLRYSSGDKQFKVPFILYADFESILKPLNDGCKGNTRKVNEHIPCGFCVYSKFAYGDVPDALKIYRGKDCVEKFVSYVQSEACRLYKLFPEKPMNKLSREEWKRFNSATVCHICLKGFDGVASKVRDHCHYTGMYRGAAHNSCNLKYKIPSFIPIVFHNLSKYDAHLFINELGRTFNREDIGCIAENKEKYISFYVKIKVQLGKSCKNVKLRFIDSLRFMQSSLDRLSSNLTDKQCKNLAMYYSGKDVFSLMRKKGVYPYEYMNSWKRFRDVELPTKEKFYSMLNMKNVNDLDYEHARDVWKTMKVKDMGEYHDIYLKTDVLLLADVFENFRDICVRHYRLDPAHFYTAPGLAWNAALKITGVSLELLTDMDMLLMFEKGIRGGITQASYRYAKANNKYVRDKYDCDKASMFLQYLDANNLYGWAMSQSLPTHGFEWVGDLSMFTVSGISDICGDMDVGYILEVDVGYPRWAS